LRERYGRAAKLRVRNEFSLQAMADRTVQLYRHAMGLPTRRPQSPLFETPQIRHVI
jgi:hypothetical protein